MSSWWKRWPPALLENTTHVSHAKCVQCKYWKLQKKQHYVFVMFWNSQVDYRCRLHETNFFLFLHDTNRVPISQSYTLARKYHVHKMQYLGVCSECSHFILSFLQQLWSILTKWLKLKYRVHKCIQSGSVKVLSKRAITFHSQAMCIQILKIVCGTNVLWEFNFVNLCRE